MAALVPDEVVSEAIELTRLDDLGPATRSRSW